MLLRRVSPVIALIALLAVTLAAAAPPAGNPEPLRPAWRELNLPTPPGPPGRLIVRDGIVCGGQWYLVGGVDTGIDDSAATRPAAWTSTDGRTWTLLTFAPTTFWGERNILHGAGCNAAGKLALLGSKRGGAHAIPRMTTWYARPDGAMTEAPAASDLYRGWHTVDVRRLAGGGNGWIIVGNRRHGAAVWRATDPTAFDVLDTDPQLSEDAEIRTGAEDAVFHGSEWIVAGWSENRSRPRRDPMLWRSTDGATWRRDPLPSTAVDESVSRVVSFGAEPLAVGPCGTTFCAWARSDARWGLAGRFGVVDPRGVLSVSGLATTSVGAFVTVSDGAVYGVWTSRDGTRWQRVAIDDPPPAGSGKVMSVVGAGNTVLVVADNGQRSWVRIADVSNRYIR